MGMSIARIVLREGWELLIHRLDSKHLVIRTLLMHGHMTIYGYYAWPRDHIWVSCRVMRRLSQSCCHEDRAGNITTTTELGVFCALWPLAVALPVSLSDVVYRRGPVVAS